MNAIRIVSTEEKLSPIAIYEGSGKLYRETE